MNLKYSKYTQTGRVLLYLQTHNKITPMVAWNILGVYRLSDVIYKLRRLGYEITTSMVPVKNRFGEKCRVAEYRLVKD